jgi:serine/threonine protein kinase
MLEKLAPHPHLTPLLCTYRTDVVPPNPAEQKWHLVFPYATGNLYAYWTKINASPKFDRKTVFWTLTQMTGLASGLGKVHHCRVLVPLTPDGAGSLRVKDSTRLHVSRGEELFGRHGDIKAENILFFQSEESGNGALKLADFGLGRFHGRDSRSHVDPSHVFWSPTYEPPELKRGLEVSRAYDIWSLGCMDLEFISWLLIGGHAIEDFSEFRAGSSTETYTDDSFYTIIEDEKTLIKDAEIREGVVDWVRKLHSHSKCSQLIHDLLHLIMTRMLLIESKDRIRIAELNEELDKLLSKACDDVSYMLEPKPWDERAVELVERCRTVRFSSISTWPTSKP